MIELLDAPISQLIKDRQTSTLDEFIYSRLRDTKLGSKLFYVKDSASVLHAFTILDENQITSLPVYHVPSEKFLGIVTIVDLLTSPHSIEAVDKYELSEDVEEIKKKDLVKAFEDIPVWKILTAKKKPDRIFYTDELLNNLIDHMLSSKHHSVLLTDRLHSNDLNWYTIVSQTDVLYYLFQNRENLSESLLNAKAKDIMLVATKTINPEFRNFDTYGDSLAVEPILVGEYTQTISALKIMNLFTVSTVGVVNESLEFVCDLSYLDFRGFDIDDVETLQLTVPEFLKKLQKKRKGNLICEMDEGFVDILTKIIKKRVHRLWVLEGKIAKGVITMTDILAIVMKKMQ